MLMLPDGEYIHTFMSTPGTLLGADWTRGEVVEEIETSRCEIGGELCRSMGHGLVIWLNGVEPVFVETRKGAVEEYDKT